MEHTPYISTNQPQFAAFPTASAVPLLPEFGLAQADENKNTPELHFSRVLFILSLSLLLLIPVAWISRQESTALYPQQATSSISEERTY